MVSRNAEDNILSGLLLVLKMFSDIIIFYSHTLTIGAHLNLAVRV